MDYFFVLISSRHLRPFLFLIHVASHSARVGFSERLARHALDSREVRHAGGSILGHRAGPGMGQAWPGHGPGTARRMSGRHGTPCLPCRAAAGLVPCQQPNHGPVGLNPCRAGLLGVAKSPGRASPRPVGFKTHQKIHLNKKYSNLKYFFLEELQTKTKTIHTENKRKLKG